MSEEPREEQRKDQHPIPLSQTLGFGAGTFVTVGVIDLLAHWGPTGLVIGGILAYVAAKHGPELAGQVREALPSPPAGQPEIKGPQQHGKRSFIDRALGRFPKGELASAEAAADDTVIVPGEEIEATTLQPEADPAFAHTAAQTDVPGVARLTIEQIVSHIERNSYEIYIGRSLTRPNNPAVRINFYKRHLKLLGASQHGKSSMAAALIEIILRTHDPHRVQLVLLDHEDKTSRLFADVPHLAKVRLGERVVCLHARRYEQVLEHLEYLAMLIDYRYYHLSEEEIEQQPLVIVYLEEFIDLKDYFKHRIDTVEKDEKEQAKRDYARLIFCMKKIARRGLKVLVQLLMCAHVDYRDEDLQEALINVTSGMSFCLRVTAATAAGFYQTELLQRNAREDQVGQAVVEMPDCKDLILAPANDLHARLKALEAAERQDTSRAASKHTRLSQTPSIDERQPVSFSFLPQAEKITRPPAQSPHSPRPAEARYSGTALSSDELQAALKVFQPGMTYRDLRRALRYTDDKARTIWQELRRRGLLRVSKEQEPAEQESLPKPHQPVSEDGELERALCAYDKGHTTIDALAVALGKTPWTVRLLYQQVKKLRGQNVG
jgi:hypothetical protein